MTILEKTLSVSAIKEGTVIDHITPGSALILIHLLKISANHCVTIGLNLSSRSMGLKDLIKIEGRNLSEKEMENIAIFAPLATINFVENYLIAKKIKAYLPSVVEKILICPNLKCITNHDHVETSFFVEEFKNTIHLQCKYCEKIFERKEIKHL